MSATTMSNFVRRLQDGPVEPRAPNEAWADMIARTTVPGRVCEVDEKTYDYFLDLIPPRFMSGGWFGFAEGGDPARVFWAVQAGNARKFYCRQLSDAEHVEFCRAARIGLSSG